MRSRVTPDRTLRLSLLLTASLLLAACGGDGYTFYAEETDAGTTDSRADSKLDQSGFTDYKAGVIPGYPLDQSPAVGSMSLTWLIAEFNGSQSPQRLVEQIQATNDGFRHYAARQSRGKFQLQTAQISEPLQITTSTGELPTLGKMQQLAREAASATGLQFEDHYITYLFAADGFDDSTFQSNNESKNESKNDATNENSQPGSFTVSADFDSSEIIHEMFHMLSIGDANAMDGSAGMFPGQIIKAGDPYHFMGSFTVTEESAGGCLTEASACDFSATMSIPHKGRVGWLDTNEVFVSGNTGVDKTFRIYNHNNFDRIENRPLTIYLTGYDPNGLFAVSYLPTTGNDRIISTGVMLHYVPYDSASESYLIDLTPDSINNGQAAVAPSSDLTDFNDAAITGGTSIDVAGLFTVDVLGTGQADANDQWADIKIIPSSCIYPVRDFATDDFSAAVSSNTNGYCKTNYSYDWGVKAARSSEVVKAEESLEYRNLDLIGGSLQLAIPEAAKHSLGLSRPLASTYSDGDTLWVSYLLMPRQIGDGHLSVYPESVAQAGIGKKWGDQFAIGDETAASPQYPTSNEVTWLLGKYDLEEGLDTITMWVNPETGIEPTAENAYAIRRDIDIGDISSISINLGLQGGAYDIDRIYTGDKFTDISNVLAAAVPASPLIALHYDLSPDLDDLQSIAAGASLSEKFEIYPAVVIGTYGRFDQFQHGDNPPVTLEDLYLSHTNMLGQGANDGDTRREKGRQVADAAYGEGDYLDTGEGWTNAVNAQAEKFWVSLRGGQSVFVADGGPMDFTADVLTRLQSHHGASDSALKQVTVVQHSLGFNTTKTLPENLQKIRDMATYVTIDNGNIDGNSTANLEDRGINTTNSDFAQWARNSSLSEAWSIALTDFSAKIDFSDTVEYLHILEIPMEVVSDVNTFYQLFD